MLHPPERRRPQPDAASNRRLVSPQCGSVVEESVLRLQRTVGNAVVRELLTQRSGEQTGAALSGPLQVQRAPGPLSSSQESAAVTFTTASYDERSIRIIQLITGSAVTGVFDEVSAQSVAAFQGGRGGLLVDGKMGPRTLTPAIADRVTEFRHEHAIQLVIDLNNLDVTSDTLAVQFDPDLTVARATTFEPGRLRIVRVGAPAFANHTTLLSAISAGLRTAAPAATPGGPRPATLSDADLAAAIAANKARLADVRSARAVQGHVRSNPDGAWGPDTVQRVAVAQGAAGLPTTGVVDEATLRVFTAQLIAAGNPNAPLRLIVDYFDLADDFNLLAIYVDPTITMNAATELRPNEPVRVRVGPKGLTLPFAGLVHTIAHEFEHVRRLHAGEASPAVHEFLAEAVEIVSAGMPTEELETTDADPRGFADDAARGLDAWKKMATAEQALHQARFVEVRQVVRDRIAAGTPAQQTRHAQLLADYNAVASP